MRPLRRLMTYGQSYWMDNLTRGMITSGELGKRGMEEDLRGITSNPSIVHQAIASSHDYDTHIGETTTHPYLSGELFLESYRCAGRPTALPSQGYGN